MKGKAMTDWLVKLYDGKGEFVGSEWFKTKRAPLLQACKLVRDNRKAVRYEVLEDGREPVAGQYDMFSTLNTVEV